MVESDHSENQTSAEGEYRQAILRGKDTLSKYFSGKERVKQDIIAIQGIEDEMERRSRVAEIMSDMGDAAQVANITAVADGAEVIVAIDPSLIQYGLNIMLAAKTTQQQVAQERMVQAAQNNRPAGLDGLLYINRIATEATTLALASAEISRTRYRLEAERLLGL